MSGARSIARVALAATSALLFTGGAARADGGSPDALRSESEEYARFWVGVSGAVDFVHLPAASDVCKDAATGRPANGSGYYCTSGDSDFPSSSQNMHLTVPGEAGRVGAGFGPGDVRLMLAADYAFTPNVLAGARLGYVFNAYPGSSAVSDGRALGFKVHAELRASYLFGHNPLGHEGFAPMVFAGGGVSQFDGHTTTSVMLDNATGQVPVTAWITNAPFFFVIGGGVRYQFSSRVAFTAAVRFNGAIGGGGFLPTFGPEIALQYGF